MMQSIMSTSIGERFPFAVNYGLTVKEAIGVGKYDWVDPDITTNNATPIPDPRTTLTAVLKHFDQHTYCPEVEDDLDQSGLRPATLAELLAYGAAYPEIQRQFPIIAIGTSFWRKDSKQQRQRHSPCLFVAGPNRFLELDAWNHGWARNYRFLAICK